MSRPVPQDDLQAVLQAVGHFMEGAAIDEIEGALPIKLPRRTLQRRLAQLVQQGSLTISGRSRGSRYQLSNVAATSQVGPGLTEIRGGDTSYIPISAEAEVIRQAMRRPLHERHPVGYNRRFLDAYRPNHTFYLPADTRQRLADRGRSPDGERSAGTFARQIFDRLLIDLSWNSSRLEGNTYSLLETERLLALGEAAEGKDAREAQMILNHKAAIEFLVESADEVGFNPYTVLNLHALLSDNLLADPKACGRLRAIPVGISGTVYHPLEVPQLIEECFQQILDTAAAIEDPFEQAFFVMVHMPYLQPFEDVNKRVSRLAANMPFIRQNLCPLSFVDVPERAYMDGILGVYELNRIELLHDVFVWAYERSSARYAAVRQSLGEPDPFRLRYRALIFTTVAEIVRSGLGKQAASTFIRGAAIWDSPANGARFVEVVETELMALHEGNIARYRLRPSEFAAWKNQWQERKNGRPASPSGASSARR